MKTRNAIKRIKQFTTVDIADLNLSLNEELEIESIDMLTPIDTSKSGLQEYNVRVVYTNGSREVLSGSIEVVENRASTFKYDPYVARPSRPVNEIKDYHDYNRKQDIPIYHTFISDGALRILITVIHNDIFEDDANQREYQVISYDGLFLDSGNSYYRIRSNQNLSINPEITQSMFSNILDKYGIVLEKVIMHDYSNYEVPKFSFSNLEKRRELEDVVNKKFSR